jgi:hypothetical protein
MPNLFGLIGIGKYQLFSHIKIDRSLQRMTPPGWMSICSSNHAKLSERADSADPEGIQPCMIAALLFVIAVS